MTSEAKQDRGRIRQLMGDERRRRNRIAQTFYRLVKEYGQGRAGSSCWDDLMKAAKQEKAR